jgi:hypothetical protein
MDLPNFGLAFSRSFTFRFLPFAFHLPKAAQINPV